MVLGQLAHVYDLLPYSSIYFQKRPFVNQLHTLPAQHHMSDKGSWWAQWSIQKLKSQIFVLLLVGSKTELIKGEYIFDQGLETHLQTNANVALYLLNKSFFPITLAITTF